jgi:transcriptional regulator with XRE-family HTH domain
MSHADTVAKFCCLGKQPIAYMPAHASGMAKTSSKPINIVVAENIAQAMERRNIRTQAELAKRSGVAQRTISNHLNPANRVQGASGKPPSAKLSELEQIARALDVETWDLLRDLTPTEREFYAKIEAAYRSLRDQT